MGGPRFAIQSAILSSPPPPSSFAAWRASAVVFFRLSLLPVLRAAGAAAKRAILEGFRFPAASEPLNGPVAFAGRRTRRRRSGSLASRPRSSALTYRAMLYEPRKGC